MSASSQTTSPVLMPKVTCFHDGECPICNIEIKAMKKLDKVGNINWVDISQDKVALAKAGLTYKQAMDRIKLKEEQLERLKQSGQFINEQFTISSQSDYDIDYDTEYLLNSLCDSGYYEDISPNVKNYNDEFIQCFQTPVILCENTAVVTQPTKLENVNETNFVQKSNKVCSRPKIKLLKF